jgi:sarcosine oxidase delta subunit
MKASKMTQFFRQFTMIAEGFMWNGSGMFLAACLLFPSLSSCGSVTPHENFVAIMRSQLGRDADDPNSYTGRYRGYRLSMRDLANGDVEEEYERGEKCRHFFEIDKKTRKIVGWRFEGRERDCGLVP